MVWSTTDHVPVRVVDRLYRATLGHALIPQEGTRSCSSLLFLVFRRLGVNICRICLNAESRELLIWISYMSDET